MREVVLPVRDSYRKNISSALKINPTL